MNYDPNLVVPPEVVKAALLVREFGDKNNPGGEWQVMGLQPVQPTIGYYKARMETAELKLDRACRLLDDQAVEIERLIAENKALKLSQESAREALSNIRSAGNNCNDWATWAQRTAAWGMAPDKWPKQDKDAPEW